MLSVLHICPTCSHYKMKATIVPLYFSDACFQTFVRYLRTCSRRPFKCFGFTCTKLNLMPSKYLYYVPDMHYECNFCMGEATAKLTLISFSIFTSSERKIHSYLRRNVNVQFFLPLLRQESFISSLTGKVLHSACPWCIQIVNQTVLVL